ncbi:hypothetical protein M0R04_12780 [Candidatus Dojkabacteria bacterium]|jgi:hypothetical protein|nr:hypothetical protein [Candidatus Dojkabacteria bacterium]
MYKFKVLGGSWGEGYVYGDIIQAEMHAMTERMAKGEVECLGGVFTPYKEGVVKEVIEKVEETKKVSKPEVLIDDVVKAVKKRGRPKKV